jgi:DNA polymerase-1
MRYHHYTSAYTGNYPVAILVPVINTLDIERQFLNPCGLDKDDVLVLGLHQGPGGKTTKAEMVAFIKDELQGVLDQNQVKYLLVANGEYFKTYTGVPKVDPWIGYVLPSEYGSQNVTHIPDFRAVFYNPGPIRERIKRSIDAVISHAQGKYVDPGSGININATYPHTLAEIQMDLQGLLAQDCDLACDIETFHLKPHKAGIATIAFAPVEGVSCVFPVDYQVVDDVVHTEPNEPVRKLLREFFTEFANQGRKLRFHNISFDVSVLIYQLFMKDLGDTESLLNGLKIMLANWDDTKLITYLATNSCVGNKLSLKDQAQEFAGNYGLGDDIKDVTKIPLPKLLQYNLVDALSTNFVYDKHWNTMLRDNQLEVYETIFKPAIVDIIQMQLTGLPVNMDRVLEVEAILKDASDDAKQRIQSSQLVQEYTHTLKEKWVAEKNATLKKKRVTLNDVPNTIVFNPNSDPQMQGLLYGMLSFPVIARTDSGQPSTKAEVLRDLKNHTKNQRVLDLLDAVLDLAAVDIILSTFIPALKDAAPGADGWHYLLGNFNLGGTISGRLSSSDPNLQNLPAGAEGDSTKKGYYGKLIKSCIQAPPGWVFGGLDFASLEDRISALTTKDPNKLKVYTDGYDGHSLRAYAYYSEQMPDIDPNSVESINSIQTKYKPQRSKSKNPTFTLTYQGTWQTLVNKYKFDPEQAKTVEQRYHELYKVSDEWVAAKLNQAAQDGYVTVAFGLRVRTPLLAQVIRGNKKTPHEAEAEGRSAGNALGQSWCLLNSRACSEFMGNVRKSRYRLDIRPCAHIHDAQYYLFRDDIEVVEYANIHLVHAVQWQDHPDIWHEQVKLGGELSLYYPSWAKEIVIPNGANSQQILEVINKHFSE